MANLPDTVCQLNLEQQFERANHTCCLFCVNLNLHSAVKSNKSNKPNTKVRPEWSAEVKKTVHNIGMLWRILLEIIPMVVRRNWHQVSTWNTICSFQLLQLYYSESENEFKN